MSTEIGSFLDWFEARCERAAKVGFVELKAKEFGHGRHSAGKRTQHGKRKSDFIEVSKRNVRHWAPVSAKKLKRAA